MKLNDITRGTGLEADGISNANLIYRTSCPDVPGEVLNPRNNWADKKKYDETATRLVGMFKENFRKHAPNVTANVANVM